MVQYTLADQEDCAVVEVMTTEEYRREYPNLVEHEMLLRSMRNGQYCKADMLRQSVVGTFVIPHKTDPDGEGVLFGYYLDKNRLMFIDDNDVVDNWIQNMTDMSLEDETATAHFFFEFLELLIYDDVVFLQQYETRMDAFEDDLMENHLTDFEKKIQVVRRELSVMESYYSQLSDLSEALSENSNNIFHPEDCRLFSLFAARVSRLYDTTHSLRDYSMQLFQMYQSKIDLRQNQIMQFLTVVTTIFMPLTLITGWYGMNFKNMPELDWEIGYPVMIGISAVIIFIEILYFKKKNWFK